MADIRAFENNRPAYDRRLSRNSYRLVMESFRLEPQEYRSTVFLRRPNTSDSDSRQQATDGLEHSFGNNSPQQSDFDSMTLEDSHLKKTWDNTIPGVDDASAGQPTDSTTTKKKKKKRRKKLPAPVLPPVEQATMADFWARANRNAIIPKRPGFKDPAS
jgi:hypothetical protein